MDFKDYYQALGVERSATQEVIKRAYRKLARKYHPDVSKEPDAENRFKAVAEAHEALIDPERRAAYDDLVRRRAQAQARGQPFNPAAGAAGDYEFSGRGADLDGADFSEFFASLFGRAGRQAGGRGPGGRPSGQGPGADHHARIEMALEDAYLGTNQTLSLRHPVLDAQGQVTMQQRQLEVHIPKGVRPGQHLRLAGQGEPGEGGAPAGDLYLEIAFRPHPHFRIDGADLWFDLPVAPWEAALGASVNAPTPEGVVQLSVPAGSTAGRKLRLKGRGLPGKQPGDHYAVLQIALPAADTDAARAAYAAMAAAFPQHDPRHALEGRTP